MIPFLVKEIRTVIVEIDRLLLRVLVNFTQLKSVFQRWHHEEVLLSCSLSGLLRPVSFQRLFFTAFFFLWVIQISQLIHLQIVSKNVGSSSSSQGCDEEMEHNLCLMSLQQGYADAGASLRWRFSPQGFTCLPSPFLTPLSVSFVKSCTWSF